MSSCGGSGNTRCNDNVWYCSTEHSTSDPFRTLFNQAASGKEDLMCLNNRLADLFAHLESPNGEKMDYEKFLKAIACLQEEIKKLKAAYEAEISNLRREVEKQTGEKHNMIHEAEKCNNLIETNELKLDDAVKEARKRKDELSQLKCYVTMKEKELAEMTCILDNYRSELELMCPKMVKYQQDSEIHRCQWENERKARQELEQAYNTLCEKLNFDTRMHQQTVRDLEDRLKRANDIIMSLTDELKGANGEGEGGDCSCINAMLQRIREKMMTEFDKYKQDTEDAVNAALKDMRCQLERRQKEKQEVEQERDRLACLLTQLQGQVNELEGMVSASTTGNQQLHKALQDERLCACKNVRDLEAKLLECQDSIMQKIREVAAARDVQTQLRSEIESYQALIECQEAKHNRACKTVPNANTSGVKNPLYNNKGYPQPGCCGQGVSMVTGQGSNQSMLNAMRNPPGVPCSSCNPCNAANPQPCVGQRTVGEI